MPRYQPGSLPCFDVDEWVLIYEQPSGHRKVYQAGDQYIIKKIRGDDITSEAAAHEFVQRHTKVPVPRIYDEWDEGGWHYIMQSRIPGRSLKDCWRELTTEAKVDIAQEVADYMAELSRLRGRALQGPSGEKLYHNAFVPRTHNAYLGTWATDDDIFDHEFRPALARAGVAERVVRALRHTMPPCEGQFVFTHGDLYTGNVMVDPARGAVTGIIDWECAGFWPHWFQYARITHGCSRDDGEWKLLLSMLQRDAIPHAMHGRVWYDAVQSFLFKPDSLHARVWLRMLMEYVRGERTTLDGYNEVTEEMLRDQLRREGGMELRGSRRLLPGLGSRRARPGDGV
ncbi:hypothetical protein VTK56DRAFT_8172 [Thermocarpiscus australiensis]